MVSYLSQSSEVIVQHNLLQSNGAHNVLEFIDLFLQAVNFIGIVDLQTQVQDNASPGHCCCCLSLLVPGRSALVWHLGKVRIKHIGPSLVDLDTAFMKPIANGVFIVWGVVGHFPILCPTDHTSFQ